MQVVGQQRARADNAHLTAKNVENLRQFVNAVLAQPSTGAGDARIRVKRCKPGALVDRVFHHCPELPDQEWFSVLTGAVLAEEDGTGRVELNENSNNNDDGREDDQQTCSPRNVEAAFESDFSHRSTLSICATEPTTKSGSIPATTSPAKGPVSTRTVFIPAWAAPPMSALGLSPANKHSSGAHCRRSSARTNGAGWGFCNPSPSSAESTTTRNRCSIPRRATLRRCMTAFPSVIRKS